MVQLMGFVLVSLLVAGVTAQATVSSGAMKDTEMDSLAKIEAGAPALDSLPKSNVSLPTHPKTPEELMADDPDALFVGRDANSLTHPTITSKVPDSHVGRGHIVGQDVVCNYLLDATHGLEQANDLHNSRIYDLAARLECNWTTCRLCQQRMNHVFEYCKLHGAKDWLLRGICEDKNPEVENARLREMVFLNNAPSCRVWRDMQVNQVRCGPDDAAICQGAFTFAEVCHYIGLNPKSFLQRNKLEDLAPWFCSKTLQCKANRIMSNDNGIEPYPLEFGNEKGALGYE
jgi:hypothetical protein